MNDLKDMTLSELKIFFKKIGEQSFRSKQVYQWIAKGVTDFDQMTDLSKNLREKLKEVAYIGNLKILEIQDSKEDGTVKFLYGLKDDNCIESVFMKYKFGNSICVSSQAGCRMGCVFCASTQLGLARNLTAGEIVDQILCAEKHTGEKIGHVVVMGMGEPFDNYENLSRFIYMINSEIGLNIGMRNITVSTCGLVPFIDRFGDDFSQVNLAISLHGTNDDIRSKIMPINKKYRIEELIATCKKYTNKTGRRVTFEYTLIVGENDKKEYMDELVKLLRGMLCHVNLIPLNGVSETGFKGIDRKKALEMANYLDNRGITATVRRELGSDIDAACGQLRLGKK